MTALSVQQIADLQTGRGMGLSLVAELNGCPGPLHVLELGEVSSSLRCSGRGQKGLLDAVKAPEGFRTLHVHDLRHTVGRRLREAGVAHETRQAILGHKSGSITTHYSAAELRELIDAMEFIPTDNACESHALTLLKRKAG